MKKIVIYAVTLTAILFTLSCNKEDAITPSSAESGERFTFPQGTNDYDQTAKKIYEDFGVKIIYKGFKNTDFNLAWTTPAIGKTGYDIPQDQQKEAVNYIANSIFGFLTPEITKKVLPPYFYVADSIGQLTVTPTAEFVSPTAYYYTGMDFWSFTWNPAVSYTKIYATGVITYSTRISKPNTSFSSFYRRGVMLKEIFKGAVNNGNIKVPESFNTGFDFITPIKNATADANDVNYYKKRGFPGRWSNTLNFNSSITTNLVSTLPNTGITQNFIDYIHLCMRFQPDSIEVNYPISQYPLIHQKYPIVIQYMKDNYNIDLAKIATKP